MEKHLWNNNKIKWLKYKNDLLTKLTITSKSKFWSIKTNLKILKWNRIVKIRTK